MSLISIIIPSRESETPYRTLDSLRSQLKDCEIIIVYDEGKGAAWARNQGAGLSRGDYLLFSDNDVIWEPDAVQNLYQTLFSSEIAGYSYGWYEMEGACYCQYPFSPSLLVKKSYISTMSLVRKDLFPGFDEKLLRLQDWDLWLTLLARGVIGVYCPHKIFTTSKRNGITYGGGISWEVARKIVMKKHNLT